MSIVINPNDTCAVSLNALAAAVTAAESAGGGFPQIVLPVNSVTEVQSGTGPASGQVITTPYVSGLGSWTLSLVDGYDAGGRVSMSGSNLVTTDKPFDYEVASQYALRFLASKSDGTSFTGIVTLYVLDIDEDGPDPSVDMNFINVTYNGAALADLGATTSNVTALGLKVEGLGTQYLVKDAMRLGNVGSWARGWSVEITELPAEGEFVPINFYDPRYGDNLSQDLSRVIATNEIVTVKIKVAPVGDVTSVIRMAIFNQGTISLTVDGATGVVTKGAGAAYTVISNVTESDKSTTFVFSAQKGAGQPDRFYIEGSAGGAFNTKIYGIQVVAGASDAPWYQSTTADTIAGYAPVLSGTLDALMKSTDWTLALELNGNGLGVTAPAPIISSGTTGTEATLAKFGGFTHISDSADTIVAAAPTSGMFGLCRVVLARSASGLSMCLNGGDVRSVANPASLTGLIKILSGNAIYIRRLSFWNSKVSDASMLSQIASLDNRTFTSIGSAFPMVPGTLQMWDNFTADGVRIHAGTAATYTQGNFEQQDDNYYDASVEAANTDANGKPKRWIPRFYFHDDYRGGVKQSINGERQLYLDPQWVIESEASGVDWGGYRPISYPQVASPGVEAGSYVRLTCQLTTNLPAAAQALIPNEQQNGGQADLGVKWQFVSGCLRTSRFREPILMNNRRSTRARYPGFMGTWAASWQYSIDQQEIDDLESNGGRPGRINQAIHRDSFAGNTGYNPNLPISFIDGWHNHEVWFHEGLVYVGVNGLLLATLDATGVEWENFRNAHYYHLLNFAIDAGVFGQTFDDTTKAAMPLHFDVDSVRVLLT